MNALDQLQAAREKIAHPEHWCKQYLALDKDGEPVSVRDPSACMFCAVGAIFAVQGSDAASEAEELLHKASREIYGHAAHHTNDRRTHAEVLGIFDWAMQLARSSA